MPNCAGEPRRGEIRPGISNSVGSIFLLHGSRPALATACERHIATDRLVAVVKTPVVVMTAVAPAPPRHDDTTRESRRDNSQQEDERKESANDRPSPRCRAGGHDRIWRAKVSHAWFSSTPYDEAGARIFSASLRLGGGEASATTRWRSVHTGTDDAEQMPRPFELPNLHYS